MNFDLVCANRELASLLNKLEASFTLTDEESIFRNLVGVARNKTESYQKWAKYREAYSHALVKELLTRSKFNPNRHYILDPMCGSGSSLVASVQKGFDSFGLDVSPYAVDLTSTKIRYYSHEAIRETKDFITKRTKIEVRQSDITLAKENLREYFDLPHLNALFSIREAIEAIEYDEAKHLLLVAWLAIIEDCSNRSKDGNGLSTRRTKIASVWEHYVSRVQMFLDDIRRDPMPKSVNARAERGSALESATQVNSFGNEIGKEVGAIIFSPPYANSFDYFESYKMELLAEYYDTEELVRARNAAIRNYRKGYHRELTANDELVQNLCDEIRKRIPAKEAKMGGPDNRTRLVPNLLAGYFNDMEQVFSEIAKYTPTGSPCYVVVDQSSYLGMIVPTDLLLANIAKRNGFEVRGLIYCGKANTSAQQLIQYQYLGEMLRTSIVSLSRSREQ